MTLKRGSKRAAGLLWNADHFHFDYEDSDYHLVCDYNFKNSDTYLDRHGECSYLSVPTLEH